ncbi:hypothetical protein ECP02999175_5446 [Escherichia coli P0299917.5]|nr:hypothetical protein ECP02999175_5446 [Escherichia coli P0299917.5]
MNGFRNSSRNGQVWRWQRAGSRAVILEVSGRWMEAAEAWRRAAGVAPGQTGSSLPEKGLNSATGAAGEGCNEKVAFITPGIQKAE